MTPEEIKALIAEAVKTQMSEGLKAGFREFRTFFDEQLKATVEPLAAKLTEFEAAMTAPEGVGLDGAPLTPEDASEDTEPTPEKMKDPAYKALQERLATMEAKEQERERQLAAERFSKALRSAISPENPLHSSVVEELLTRRFDGLVETDGVFYNAKGDKLEELVRGFFATPEGQHFKPAKSRQGTGEQPSNPATTPATKSEPTLEEMLKGMAI